MKTTSLIAWSLPALAVVLALAAGLPAAPVEPAASALPAAPRIGFVDWTRVVEKSEFRRAGELKIRRFQAASQDKNNEMVREIERLYRETETYAMGTEERMALDRKTRDAVHELETWREVNRAETNRRLVELIEAVYTQMLAEIDGLAGEMNLDMVLKQQTRSVEKPEAFAEAIDQISQRIVLYAKPEYDLTDRVIDRINKLYSDSTDAPARNPVVPEAGKEE